jgi:hypothetical protein
MSRRESPAQPDLFLRAAAAPEAPADASAEDREAEEEARGRFRAELGATLERARTAATLPWRDLTLAALAEIRFNSLAGRLPPEEGQALRDAFARELDRLYAVEGPTEPG